MIVIKNNNTNVQAEQMQAATLPHRSLVAAWHAGPPWASPAQQQRTANMPQGTQGDAATDMRSEEASDRRSVHFAANGSQPQRGAGVSGVSAKGHKQSGRDAAMQSPSQLLRHQLNSVLPLDLESEEGASGSAAASAPVAAKQTGSASQPQAKRSKSRPSFVEGF